MGVFRHRLKQARLQKKLSQKELAEKVGVAISTVSRWESGRQSPDPDTVRHLAEVLDVSVNYLLGVIDFLGAYSITDTVRAMILDEIQKALESELTMGDKELTEEEQVVLRKMFMSVKTTLSSGSKAH